MQVSVIRCKFAHYLYGSFVAVKRNNCLILLYCSFAAFARTAENKICEIDCDRSQLFQFVIAHVNKP